MLFKINAYDRYIESGVGGRAHTVQAVNFVVCRIGGKSLNEGVWTWIIDMQLYPVPRCCRMEVIYGIRTVRHANSRKVDVACIPRRGLGIRSRESVTGRLGCGGVGSGAEV